MKFTGTSLSQTSDEVQVYAFCDTNQMDSVGQVETSQQKLLSKMFYLDSVVAPKRCQLLSVSTYCMSLNFTRNYFGTMITIYSAVQSKPVPFRHRVGLV